MTLLQSARLALLSLVLLASTADASRELFPQPPELQPDVDFWLAVFTDYSVDEGVLHDNRNLGVVYERLAMPAELSRRERQRRVAARRKSLQKVLRRLASGKREQLTTEEARVLALWPDNVSNKTLADAAKRIRYQQGLRERFRDGLQRSGRWRDYVNQQFTVLGVPLEIAALPHVESSYNPAARSHIGASGIWQFTRSTGRRFMRVDHVVDERNDPFAATRAAGQLMAYNYSLTGNWPMAITAYNHGLSGVRRAMKQFGDTAYVDILRNYKGRTFGFASRNFYVAFLAAMEVDQNAERYFPGLTYDKPIDYAVTKMPAYMPANALARSLGVTPAELAQHNPGLQPTIWQGSKYLPKGYEVRLPASALTQPMPALLANVPPDNVFAKQLPDMFHTVARGDTLSQIAAAYDTRVSTLVMLNNLGSRHRIRAGQRLRLPAAGPAPAAVTVAAVKPAEPEPVAVASTAPSEPEPIVVASAEPEAEPAGTALLSDPSDYSVSDDNTIEVQPLETLGHFGDWLQIKTQRLRDINGLAFGRSVEVGQRIRLDLAKVGAAKFEERRIEYHRMQQDEYFRQHVITSVKQHTIRRGESIWVLSLRRYGVPFWLFRQYNPTIDVHNVKPGTVVQFPVLSDVETS
ncbi:MAG: LysM peptidoglycan-binding domain-containing protein [Gammaproteobacteria bacterium]|nr:LysM peptidoglycan-binding domain-containing protein [Gammaproteobacteria bacterium]